VKHNSRLEKRVTLSDIEPRGRMGNRVGGTGARSRDEQGEIKAQRRGNRQNFPGSDAKGPYRATLSYKFYLSVNPIKLSGIPDI
jgi:hypothetical protein